MDKRVLRFTASWCGPCKALAKHLENIETSIPIEVIDIDVQSETAVEYGVRGVPTLVMLEGNNEIKRLVGVKPQKNLEDWLND